MNTMLLSTPVERGCGSRQDGGVYLDYGGDSEGNVAFESLLIDPPFPTDAYRMTKRGISMIERGGVFHLVDWIGSRHYPNPTDFFEEAKRFGVSRRIPANTNFGKLSPDSRIFFVHAHAYIDNLDELIEALPQDLELECPKHLTSHDPPYEALLADPDEQMCAAYWYRACRGATVAGVREFTPNVTYEAYPLPRTFEDQTRPAIFMAAPATQFVVVGQSAKAQTNLEKMAIARQNGLTVERSDH